MEKEEKKPIDLNTTANNTWCPGCFNFMILAGVKKVIQQESLKNSKQKFAMASGIGCHAKIFDYLNLPGINTLHGRVLPTMLGMKVGNPNLSLIGFSGDGDAYAEGMEHLIHISRFNPNMKYFVHNNQVFALTAGQPSPATELGYKDKIYPQGNKIHPVNPIKLMLASGCGFVARVYADLKQIEWVFQEALKYNGFAFIEVLQPCIIFHPDAGLKGKTYLLQDDKKYDKSNMKQAMEKAEEFDYNSLTEKTKVPLGIFYQKESITLEENIPQLASLKKKGISFRDIKR